MACYFLLECCPLSASHCIFFWLAPAYFNLHWVISSIMNRFKADRLTSETWKNIYCDSSSKCVFFSWKNLTCFFFYWGDFFAKLTREFFLFPSLFFLLLWKKYEKNICPQDTPTKTNELENSKYINKLIHYPSYHMTKFFFVAILFFILSSFLYSLTHTCIL